MVTNYTLDTTKANEYDITDYIDVGNDYRMRTNYEYVGTMETIDSGHLTVLRLNDDNIKDIQSIELEVKL
jgi:hypothetical protein